MIFTIRPDVPQQMVERSTLKTPGQVIWQQKKKLTFKSFSCCYWVKSGSLCYYQDVRARPSEADVQIYFCCLMKVNVVGPRSAFITSQSRGPAAHIYWDSLLHLIRHVLKLASCSASDPGSDPASIYHKHEILQFYLKKNMRQSLLVWSDFPPQTAVLWKHQSVSRVHVVMTHLWPEQAALLLRRLPFAAKRPFQLFQEAQFGL